MAGRSNLDLGGGFLRKIFRARPERLEFSMLVEFSFDKGRPHGGAGLCNLGELIKGCCEELQGRGQGEQARQGYVSFSWSVPSYGFNCHWKGSPARIITLIER